MDRVAALEMSPEEFRSLGHEMVDRIAEFLRTLPTRPIAPGETPGQVRAHPELAPGPGGLSIATFRFVPRGLQGRPVAIAAYLDELNREIVTRIQAGGGSVRVERRGLGDVSPACLHRQLPNATLRRRGAPRNRRARRARHRRRAPPGRAPTLKE